MPFTSADATYGLRVTRTGAELATLLLGGFRTFVQRTQDELEARGHPDHRPVHHFALRAVHQGADTVTELGRRLDVTRQAAAKTVEALEERGYLARSADGADRRRRRLQVTARGVELLEAGEATMAALRTEWARRIGADELDRLQDALALLVATPAEDDDTAGWLVRDLGGS